MEITFEAAPQFGRPSKVNKTVRVPIIRYRQWFETSINDYDSQNIDSSTLHIDSASQYIELFSKNY